MSARSSARISWALIVLTARRHKRRHCPFIELVYRLQIPACTVIYFLIYRTSTYIRFCLCISSSTTSRLAFAIICITWRSCPPPTRTAPPVVCCVALDAPESAVSVPANALVDQVGRFEASGDVTVGTGLVEWCVRLYNGVSDGDSRNKWCDMISGEEDVGDNALIPGPCLVFVTLPNWTE